MNTFKNKESWRQLGSNLQPLARESRALSTRPFEATLGRKKMVSYTREHSKKYGQRITITINKIFNRRNGSRSGAPESGISDLTLPLKVKIGTSKVERSK